MAGSFRPGSARPIGDTWSTAQMPQGGAGRVREREAALVVLDPDLAEDAPRPPSASPAATNRSGLPPSWASSWAWAATRRSSAWWPVARRSAASRPRSCGASLRRRPPGASRACRPRLPAITRERAPSVVGYRRRGDGGRASDSAPTAVITTADAAVGGKADASRRWVIEEHHHVAPKGCPRPSCHPAVGGCTGPGGNLDIVKVMTLVAVVVVLMAVLGLFVVAREREADPLDPALDALRDLHDSSYD